MIQIREANSLDEEAVHKVHMRAFPAEERAAVAALAVGLLDHVSDPETIALIAENEGSVVGHLGLSPVFIDDARQWQAYILAPLGVVPEHQNQRVGSKLVAYAIEWLKAAGVDIIFVYGDPAYYRRFGFTEDAASEFPPPYPLQFPFGWQAIRFTEGDACASGMRCVAPLCDPTLW